MPKPKKKTVKIKTRSDNKRAPSEEDKAIGRKVRILRKEAGLSLNELASLLNISHQQLQKYEVGHNRISAGILVKMTRVLNIPITSFFHDAMTNEEDKNNLEHSIRQDIINSLSEIDEIEDLKRILRIIEVL